MNNNNAGLYSWDDLGWRGETEDVWFCGTTEGYGDSVEEIFPKITLWEDSLGKFLHFYIEV